MQEEPVTLADALVLFRIQRRCGTRTVKVANMFIECTYIILIIPSKRLSSIRPGCRPTTLNFFGRAERSDESKVVYNLFANR